MVFSNGNLGEGERGGCAGNRQDVRVVLRIGGEHERDDLRFVPPAGRKQRANRAIDHATREDLFFRRLAFAFEEAAGNAARRVGVFPVVDGERQEIDALPRIGRAARRHEDDGVAEPDNDGAAGLLGQLARFESEALVADGQFAGSHKENFEIRRDVVRSTCGC